MVELQQGLTIEEILDEIKAEESGRKMKGPYRDESGQIIGYLMPIEELEGKTYKVPVRLLRPLHVQPRTDFDEQKLRELGRGLREKQINDLKAVPVLRSEDGEVIFAIQDGERRYRAATLEGIEELSVRIVSKDTEDEMHDEALYDSSNRVNLSPIEQAKGFKKIIDRETLETERSPESVIAYIARRASIATSTVEDRVRLLELPEELKEMIGQKQVTIESGLTTLDAELTHPQTKVLLSRLRKKIDKDGKVSTKEYKAVLRMAKLAGGESAIGNGKEQAADRKETRFRRTIDTTRNGVRSLVTLASVDPSLLHSQRSGIEKLLAEVKELAALSGVIESRKEAATPKRTKFKGTPKEYFEAVKGDLETKLEPYLFKILKRVSKGEVRVSDLFDILKGDDFTAYIKNRNQVPELANKAFDELGIEMKLHSIDMEGGATLRLSVKR